MGLAGSLAWPALLARAQPAVTEQPVVPAPPAKAHPDKQPGKDPVECEATPESLVSKDRLMTFLAALPTKRAAWGSDEHQAGLRETEKLLVAELEKLGYKPVLHDVDWIGGGRDRKEPWHNVIVELPGGELASEIIVVGAHFDAVADGPGADDNGTGASGLLELARVLKDAPMKRTVRLCFFNLEEVGLVGSSRYALELSEDVRAGKQNIVGMVALDMLGYYSGEPDTQVWPKLPIRVKLPTTADFIAVGGLIANQHFSRPLIEGMRAAAPDCKVFAGDILPLAVPDFLRSDHAPFLAMGVPAVLVSDTANFRSPHYHRASDTIETIDQERFFQTVRGLAGGIVAVANAELARQFQPLSPGQPIPEPLPVPPILPDNPDPQSPTAPVPTGPGLGKPPGQTPETPR